MNSFQFACLLSLAVMLVFAGFLPPTSHDPSDEVSRQGGRIASGGEAASFQALGINFVANPALVQLPACLAPRAGATCCFDATRGFPGEGPKTDSPEIIDENFTNEPAAAGTNGDQLQIANQVGCTVFEELWDEMACKITGSDVQKSCTLWYKCRCTSLQRVAAGDAVKEKRTLEDLKVLKHNQKMGSVEGWAQACQLLKDTYSTAAFLNDKLKWISDNVCNEQFTSLFIHSDNASRMSALTRS